MKDKRVAALLIPLLIVNQSVFVAVHEYERTVMSHSYQIAIESNGQQEVVVENDSYGQYQKKQKREKFHSIEQRLATLEENSADLTKEGRGIQLGLILESMSGGVLYGEKANV